MKNWNKTGKIKAIILGLLSLPNILNPISAQSDFGFTRIILPLFFGLLFVPLIIKINVAIFGLTIISPTWNDNPLILKRPLSFFHFGSYFFMTSGLSMIIGTAIKFQQLNLLGMTSLAFGIGILGGINLLLQTKKNVGK